MSEGRSWLELTEDLSDIAWEGVREGGFLALELTRES